MHSTMNLQHPDDGPETVFAAPPKHEPARARRRLARRLWLAVAAALACWVLFRVWQLVAAG